MDELLSRGLDALLEQDRRLHAFFSEKERSRLQETLEAYVRELELFNPAYGLVGTESHEELIIKHILDSLAPLGPILRALDQAGSAPPSLSIADAGTGAGLPGLPLAIALPGCQFTLIERMGRRIGFLQNTLAVLGLENVRLEQADIEKARSGPFDLITFRAFRPSRAEIRDYYYQNPARPFCEAWIAPKLRLLLAEFGEYADRDRIAAGAAPNPPAPACVEQP